MDYVQDLPKGDDEALEGVKAHVRAYLSAVADEDDDPDTNADDVHVFVTDHPENPDWYRVKGVLDAEPNAPYLKPDFDPFEGIDPLLLEEAGCGS